MTEGACLLDVEPFLQTASVEEMTARSDDSTVHVLKERAQTHMSCVVTFHLTFCSFQNQLTYNMHQIHINLASTKSRCAV